MKVEYKVKIRFSDMLTEAEKDEASEHILESLVFDNKTLNGTIPDKF